MRKIRNAILHANYWKDQLEENNRWQIKISL